MKKILYIINKITTQLKNLSHNSISSLKRFTDRIWYSTLIGLIASLDSFIIFVPTDGVLISSSIFNPKRWLKFAVSVSIGSALGALVLAALVQQQGLPWILDFYPGISESQIWHLTIEFFEQYGLIFLFLFSMTPFPQQPVVILASISSTPLYQLLVIIFAGRFVKFLVFSYLASHAPQYLKKIWFLKKSVDKSQIHLKRVNQTQ